MAFLKLVATKLAVILANVIVFCSSWNPIRSYFKPLSGISNIAMTLNANAIDMVQENIGFL